MATTTTNNKRTPYHTQRCLCYELLNARGALRACVSACCTYFFPWVSTYVLQEHRVLEQYKQEVSLPKMGCCPEPMQNKGPFSAHPAWGLDLPLSLCWFFLVWTEKAMLLDENLPSSSKDFEVCSKWLSVSLLSFPRQSHSLSKSYPKWGPELIPPWAVSLTRQYSSYELLAGLQPCSFLVVLKSTLHTLLCPLELIFLPSAGFRDDSEAKDYSFKEDIHGNTAPSKI